MRGDIDPTELVGDRSNSARYAAERLRMMAFDRTPSQPTLAPETVEALRQSLSRSARQGNHSEDLRSLLCDAAAEARAKGIPAERLLLILKDIWYRLPQVASATSSDAENALLQELISRCIQQYYAE
jgi:hypothetical protein